MQARESGDNPFEWEICEIPGSQDGDRLATRPAGRREGRVAFGREENERRRAERSSEVHGPGVVAHGERGVGGEGTEISEAGPADEVDGRGRGRANGRSERLFGVGADQNRRQAQSHEVLREGREPLGGPALGGPVQGRTRNEERIALRQIEAAAASCEPGEVGRWEVTDSRHRQLFALALERVHAVAPGIGVRMGGAASDSRPWRPAGPAEILAGARGGLQVVNEIEAAERAGEPQVRAHAPEGGAGIDHDPVEPGRAAGERAEGCRGQECDFGGGMGGANGGEGTEGEHEVAERTELDDEDAPQGQGTFAHGRAIALGSAFGPILEELSMEERGRVDRGDGVELAWIRQAGREPTVVFLPGFRSEMQGEKGTHLAAFCAARGVGLLRLDYSGHGASAGRFEDGSIGRWTEDALFVIDREAKGRMVLVGSSMGGWVALLVARSRPERMAGLLGIAAAPDFTETLMWQAMSPAEQERLLAEGSLTVPSEYGPPLLITRRLIEEGRRNLVLGEPIEINCPVRLLHGQRDPDVPWETALRTAERIGGDDVRITLVKDGEHRLSRPQDLALLSSTLAGLLGEDGG
jgi:pimeloyl-ACP methyl ester carboxylesterase